MGRGERKFPARTVAPSKRAQQPTFPLSAVVAPSQRDGNPHQKSVAVVEPLGVPSDRDFKSPEKRVEVTISLVIEAMSESVDAL